MLVLFHGLSCMASETHALQSPSHSNVSFTHETAESNVTEPCAAKSYNGNDSSCSGRFGFSNTHNARLSDAKTWTTDGTTPVGDRHSLQQQEKKNSASHGNFEPGGRSYALHQPAPLRPDARA